jgi:3D-(3,5/4)-trihydroxycyclohexane-1,2-dione acylhydrolase (decyclizing)
MLAQELVTAVQENVKLTVVLVNNHGFASIGALSESVGTQRFGTWYRYRDKSTGRLDGAPLPLDFAANARSLGVTASRVSTVDELRAALEDAKLAGGPVLVEIETDPQVPAPSSESWWDVAVAEVSDLDSTVQARKSYETAKAHQRRYL